MILIDLFDHSGNQAAPYEKAAWSILQVDIKNGIDILFWDYKTAIEKAYQKAIEKIIHEKGFCKSSDIKIGLNAAIPCTDYATCGAKHFAKKDANGETEKSQLLVKKVKEIKDWVESEYGELLFWKIENPKTRIHKLNPWIGKLQQSFNPCDFAGYIECWLSDFVLLDEYRNTKMSDAPKYILQKVLDLNWYNKETWLFGKFNKLKILRKEPIWKECPMFVLYGGKSERTKELRSVDPKGYCVAFYEANH